MSKLEDKLAASIRSTRRKPGMAKVAPAADAAPAPATPAVTIAAPAKARPPEPADLNAGNPPLHPRRIWPD